MEQEAIKDFEQKGYPASIAVALCFQMGLRIGEMAALKCYCFNRKNDLQTQESLEKALG